MTKFDSIDVMHARGIAFILAPDRITWSRS